MISYDGFIIPRVLEFVSPFWGKISYNLPYEKVGNSDPVCIADEVPFEIPDSWEWVRLGSILYKLSDIEKTENEKQKELEEVNTEEQELKEE